MQSEIWTSAIKLNQGGKAALIRLGLNTFHNNRAACYIKLDNYDFVIKDSVTALGYDPNDSKGSCFYVRIKPIYQWHQKWKKKCLFCSIIYRGKYNVRSASVVIRVTETEFTKTPIAPYISLFLIGQKCIIKVWY